MTHTKHDFMEVCNEVLHTKNLDMVERIHSLSFWSDLRAYLTEIEESEILGRNMPSNLKYISPELVQDLSDFIDENYSDIFYWK